MVSWGTKISKENGTVRYRTPKDHISIPSILKNYANFFVDANPLILGFVNIESGKCYYDCGEGLASSRACIGHIPIKSFQEERVFLREKFTIETMDMLIDSKKRVLGPHTYFLKTKNKDKYEIPTLEDYIDPISIDALNMLRDVPIVAGSASSFILKGVALETNSDLTSATVRVLPICRYGESNGIYYYPKAKEITAKITLVDRSRW